MNIVHTKHWNTMLMMALVLLLAFICDVSYAGEQVVVIDALGDATSAIKDNYSDIDQPKATPNEVDVHEPVYDDDEDNVDDEDDDDEEDEDDEYYEFTDVTYFPYYPEEFEGDGRISNLCGDPNVSDTDCIEEGQFILQEYVVAGVNLAAYGVMHPKFRLFQDFNIGMFLKGNESWKDLLKIRANLKRPSLSWYVDKVARKRWLAEQGFPQPRVFWIKYKSEITGNDKNEKADVILKNIPTKHGFCAKPTHMSMTMGTWLVDLNPNSTEQVKFSNFGQRLNSNETYSPYECADSLAEGLERKAATIESWALKQVEPGLVIEELWSKRSARDLPPVEFCIFVVWGRVYTGVMNEVSDNRYLNGFYYRDGTAAAGCPYKGDIPKWVPWETLVKIAEKLGANKDMIRIDMFVGVPRYSDDDADLRIAISESEIHPTTMFCHPFIADEMARLWIAGYKMGNYEVIPNTEVPADYVLRIKQE